MNLRPGIKHVIKRWTWVFLLITLIMLAISIKTFTDAYNERTALAESRDDSFATGRPFQRMQREILKLSIIAAGGEEGFTVDDLQLQRDITASRFFDMNLTKQRNRLSPELLNVLDTANAQWEALQPQLDAYQETALDNQAMRVALREKLTDLELAVNAADTLHAIKLDQLDKQVVETEREFDQAQLLSIFLLVLSVILIAAWIIVQLRASAAEIQEVNDQLHAHTLELDDINQELEKANQLKSEFLATMSHELRTPLNSILGYAGLLKMGVRGTVDDDAKEVLKIVETSGKHLLGLINDILDIAKIEAGRMELAYEPLNLKSLTEDWSTRMRVLADKKGLDFQTSMDETLPQTIQGDKERLTQIANNLLSNAIKFTEEGKVSLNIGRDDSCWTIRVTDTGKGIPPDAQEYIFDEFRQVDGTYNRAQGGTGLGLAIVRKLIAAMNGTIQLQSKMGEGSTFLVKLPLNGQG